ncbi:MAG TPA: di-heme oxidoredictase family protein [Niabella sp.]
MKKWIVLSVLGLLCFAATRCRRAKDFPEANYDPRLSGGAATTFLANSKAFGEMVDGLGAYDGLMHSLGDKIFNQTFVSAPAQHFGGLGPVFNNVSCVSCHHNDGKGTPTMGLATSSLLTRISIPGLDEHGGPLEAAGFGLQLQDKSNNGPAEVKINISYEEIPFTFPDGETATLRKPTYTLTNLYQPLPAQYNISVRMAPPVFGLGLLELIPETTISSFADPDDKNGDGISGKMNYVYNPYTKKTELGRFGMKANTSTIQIQVASAFQQDMGITNYVFPFESCFNQPQYDQRNDDPEIADSILNATIFYARTLCVPARRDVTDPTALAGEKLFLQIGCSSCHIPTINTGVDVRLPMLSNQRIHPYTDLLLHDMGEALSDGRSDFLATGNEWRTMPLWGIGLFSKTNGIPYYLHDGRARTLQEAILWHGGEAESAKGHFVALNKSDRDALVKFLSNL